MLEYVYTFDKNGKKHFDCEVMRRGAFHMRVNFLSMEEHPQTMKDANE